MDDYYTVIDLGSGEVHFWDPYQVRGMGVPTGYKPLEDLTAGDAADVLPAFIRRTARTLREQEDRIYRLERQLDRSPTDSTEVSDA